MSVETERACGFRTIGGIYLEGPRGPGFECGRLPVPILPCAACGQQVKVSRGLQRVQPRAFLHGAGPCRGVPVSAMTPEEIAAPETRCQRCPFDRAFHTETGGLAWVGNRFYTPATFAAEANVLGVSKRINQVPVWLLESGIKTTWIFLAHPSVPFPPPAECCDHKFVEMLAGSKHCLKCGWLPEAPAIFYAFKPTRLVVIIPDDLPEDRRERLRDRGLELVEVPANDPDHAGADVDEIDEARHQLELL